MDFHFIFKKLKQEKSACAISLASDSELDAPETNSRNHFGLIKRSAILSLSTKFFCYESLSSTSLR